MHATNHRSNKKERWGANALPLLCYALVAAVSALLLWVGVGAPWIAAALFGLGIFHGGLDREEGRLVLPGWGYSGVYLILAALMVGIVLMAPVAGLTAFFALSVWHVARENEGRSGDSIASAAEALALVGASALLRPQQTYELVAAIAGRGATGLTVILGIAGFAAALLTLWALLRRSSLAPRLLLAFGGYALLPPLVAIGAAFFAFHALPRLVELVGEAGWQRGLRLAGLGVIALVGATLVLFGMTAGWWSLAATAAVFIALATPHMLLDRTLENEGTVEMH